MWYGNAPNKIIIMPEVFLWAPNVVDTHTHEYPKVLFCTAR